MIRTELPLYRETLLCLTPHGQNVKVSISERIDCYAAKPFAKSSCVVDPRKTSNALHRDAFIAWCDTRPGLQSFRVMSVAGASCVARWGNYLAVGAHGNVHLYEAPFAKGECRSRTLDLIDKGRAIPIHTINWLTFAADGSMLACVCVGIRNQYSVIVWNLSGAMLHHIQDPYQIYYNVHFYSEGFAIFATDCVEFYSLKTNKCRKLTLHVTNGAVSGDGRYLVAETYDWTIQGERGFKICDTDTGQCLRKMDIYGGGFLFAFSPGGLTLAMARQVCCNAQVVALLDRYWLAQRALALLSVNVPFYVLLDVVNILMAESVSNSLHAESQFVQNAKVQCVERVKRRYDALPPC